MQQQGGGKAQRQLSGGQQQQQQGAVSPGMSHGAGAPGLHRGSVQGQHPQAQGGPQQQGAGQGVMRRVPSGDGTAGQQQQQDRRGSHAAGNNQNRPGPQQRQGQQGQGQHPQQQHGRGSASGGVDRASKGGSFASLNGQSQGQDGPASRSDSVESLGSTGGGQEDGASSSSSSSSSERVHSRTFSEWLVHQKVDEVKKDMADLQREKRFLVVHSLLHHVLVDSPRLQEPLTPLIGLLFNDGNWLDEADVVRGIEEVCKEMADIVEDNPRAYAVLAQMTGAWVDESVISAAVVCANWQKQLLPFFRHEDNEEMMGEVMPSLLKEFRKAIPSFAQAAAAHQGLS